METALAISIGVLVAGSVYLMLARNLLRFLFGFVLLGNAANLSIFVAGRLVTATPPLIAEGMAAPVVPVANALPQALVLTAIVIGFGLFAFTLALIFRGYSKLGSLDGDTLGRTEPLHAGRFKITLKGVKPGRDDDGEGDRP